MADFGIGETLAATSAAEGGSKGAEGLGALGGAKGAETAAGAGAGLSGAADALAPAAALGTAAGAAAPLSLAAADYGGVLGPSVAGAGALDAGSIGGLGGDLAAGSSGLPAAATGAITAPATAAPAAPTAGAVAPPPGVTSPLGVDPTSILGANAPSPLDTAAYPAGPVGAPGAATAAAPSATAAAPSGTSGGFLSTLESSLSPSNIASGIGSSIAKNPLGLALATGGLGYDIMQGQKQSAAVNAMNAEAQQQGATGAQLEGYLSSGTLPPGLQASVTEAVKNAKATAISNMASQGLSTDPTKNTALAAELAGIDQQVPILTAQIGQQLLSSGEAASGLASNLYTSLANIDQTQTAQIGKSIAAMAAALSGKTSIPGTNISVSTG